MPNWLDSLHLDKVAVIIMLELQLKNYGADFGSSLSC